MFSISDSVGVLEPGVHKLSFSATAGGETVTLVYYEDGSSTPNNIIATSGEYEILTVDKTNNIVTGKMDAFYDDDNFVNGNFSLKICD